MGKGYEFFCLLYIHTIHILHIFLLYINIFQFIYLIYFNYIYAINNKVSQSENSNKLFC